MSELINLRIDLGINAQKIMQQVQIHNQGIEDAVQRGVELAVQELANSENIVLAVKAATLKEFQDLITQRVISWEVKQALMTEIDKRVGEKISEYAEKIASNITKNL